MGGLFTHPKMPVREVDPELERLKAEEQKRLDEETAAVDKKKKRLAAGMVGQKSLMSSGGYKGYRNRLGYEEQDFA